MRRIAVAATLLLGASTPLHAGLFDNITGGEKPKRVELTTGSDKTAVFKDIFAGVGPFASEVKPVELAVRKVAIAAFQIEFVTQHIAAAGKKGGLGGGGLEKTFTLKGVGDEQQLAITEGLHQQFKDLLVQRGYEIVPVEALLSSSFKSELNNVEGATLRKDESDGVLGSARSIGLIGRNSGDTHSGSVVVTARGTAPRVFDVKFGLPSAMMLADELGIAVVQARLQVNFMQIDTSNEALFSLAEAEGRPRNMLAKQGSQLSVFWPGSKLAQFTVNKSLLLPGSVGAEVTELAMTSGEKAGAGAKMALSALGGFFGGSGGRGGLAQAAGDLGGTLGSIAGSGKFEVTADADYQTKLLQDLGLVIGVYAEALPR